MQWRHQTAPQRSILTDQSVVVITFTRSSKAYEVLSDLRHLRGREDRRRLSTHRGTREGQFTYTWRRSGRDGDRRELQLEDLIGLIVRVCSAASACSWDGECRFRWIIRQATSTMLTSVRPSSATTPAPASLPEQRPSSLGYLR